MKLILEKTEYKITIPLTTSAEEVRDEVTKATFMKQIKLYATAQLFGFAELAEQCRNVFKKHISKAINPKDFIIAIGLLYESTQPSDDLGGFVVYRARLARKQLLK